MTKNTIVNSEHKNTYSKGDFVHKNTGLNRSFKRFRVNKNKYVWLWVKNIVNGTGGGITELSRPSFSKTFFKATPKTRFLY